MRQLFYTQYNALFLLGCAFFLLHAAVFAEEGRRSFDVDQMDFAQVETVDSAEVAAFDDYGADARYQRVLIAIKLDGQEVDLLEVLSEERRWWLPVRKTLLLLDINSRTLGDSLLLDTPGGTAKIPIKTLRFFEGELYVSLETLNKFLKLQARFDQAAYAINMFLPWWPERRAVEQADRDTPTADRTPPPVSLRQLRMDYFFNNAQNQERNQRIDYTLSGRAHPGVWRIEVEDDFDQDRQDLREYFWVSSHRNTQYLLGKQTIGLHSLLPNFELSGAQALYGTEALPDDPYNDLTRNQFARSLGRQSQDISGQAKPAAFVQLRVNGQIVATERANLDGTYQFFDVALGSGQFNQIEVYVIDHISRQLLEVQDLSRTRSPELFDDGQHVFAVGFGEEGNPLGRNGNSGNTGNFLQWRGGFNEQITLEAIYAHNGNDDYQLLGATTTLGQFFSASLATAFRDTDQAWRAELNGQDKKSVFSYATDFYEAGYLLDEERFDHRLRYRYFHAPHLNYGIEGRYTGGDGIDETQFLKPAVFWSPNSSTSMSASPNSVGHYRYDLRYRAKNFWNMNLSHEQSTNRMELRRSPGGPLSYYLNATNPSNSDNFYELGGNWSSYDHRNLRLGLAFLFNDQGDEGVRFQWDQQLRPGLYSRLLLNDTDTADNGADEFNQGWRVDWQLTLDLAVVGNKIIAADTQSTYNTTGAVAGQLTQVPSRDNNRNRLTRVTLLFNGIAYTADVSAQGTYYLSGIKSGLYRVRMDTKHLPLEWVPDNKSYWVRVEKGAITQVDFTLYAEYSLSGKVVDQTGKGVPALQLAVFNEEDELVARWLTDQFGYYRGDQLKPGLYRVQLEAIGDKTFKRAHYRLIEIKDDFLFDQYFIISEGELDY